MEHNTELPLNEISYPPKPIVNQGQEKISYTSILIFIVAYYLFFDQNISFVIILILVLFIHEMGHLIMMKIFDYKEVSMFFIPLVGALVTGEKQSISQKQRAFIILAGPVPGIIIGIILYSITILYYHNTYLAKAADIFIYLNVFNLLPLTPFDGGMLIENLFFSSAKKIQTVFIAISALIIGTIAIVSESYFLLIIPVFSILRIIQNNRLTRIRLKLEQEKINYTKSYDELTDEEYWQIRDVIIESDQKIYPDCEKGIYRISSKENRIIFEVKNLLKINYIKDLGVLGKILFIFCWILSIIAPLVVLILTIPLP